MDGKPETSEGILSVSALGELVFGAKTVEEISKEEYDNWRYHYPKFDTTQRWAKVPSQELSDALVEMFKDQLKPDK